MPEISEYILDEMEEVRSYVKYAFGEYIIKDNQIKYISEPATNVTDLEKLDFLQNLLNVTDDILEEYNEQIEDDEYEDEQE